MENKILKKIQKKLDKLDSLHEKEEAIIDDIKEMISDEIDEEEDEE